MDWNYVNGIVNPEYLPEIGSRSPYEYKNLQMLNPLDKWHRGTVQWLRLHASNAGGPGLIPGQVTTSHKLQLKTLHVAYKTWHSQINIYI